jgi:hypothetical protein
MRLKKWQMQIIYQLHIPLQRDSVGVAGGEILAFFVKNLELISK